MPKYWGKQIFSLGRFPEVGQKQKTGKKRERRMMVITMACYVLQTPPRVAHAKPPGPTTIKDLFFLWSGKVHQHLFKNLKFKFKRQIPALGSTLS